MRRFTELFLLGALLLLTADSSAPALTEQEKKDQFLAAREEMKTVPRATATPKPKAKPKPVSRPQATASRTPSATPPQDEETDAASARRSPSPTPSATRKPSPVPEKEDRKPTEKPSPSGTPVQGSATPKPLVSATGAAVTSGTENGAVVTIEKSGLEADEGFVEAKPEPPRFWLFGGPKYKYLTKGIREQIDRAKVKRKRWKFIVVHNSGSRQGNAKIFDYYHRYVRKMPNGLAYHFVIGNGRSSGDGEIEIGNRWKQQINGGHVHSDWLNNISIGICLVGDYNRDQPTKAQLEACEELIRYLRTRVGKVDGKPSQVLPHKRINPPRWPTDCPGDRFPYKWFVRFD